MSPARRLLQRLARCALCCFALHAGAAAAQHAVAITIDDLPRGGDGGPRDFAAVRGLNERLLASFREQRIPVTGFVNEGRADFGPAGLREVLDLWLDAGVDLGNHSYSHLNINKVPLADYAADVTRGEPVIRAALAARGRELRYFRHPYLFTGPTPEIKASLQRFGFAAAATSSCRSTSRSRTTLIVFRTLMRARAVSRGFTVGRRRRACPRRPSRSRRPGSARLTRHAQPSPRLQPRPTADTGNTADHPPFCEHLAE